MSFSNNVYGVLLLGIMKSHREDVNLNYIIIHRVDKTMFNTDSEAVI